MVLVTMAEKGEVEKSDKKKRRFRYIHIMPIIILVFVLIILILNYTKEEEKIQTTFNMEEFQNKFDHTSYYGISIEEDYLNRDLYIIDTITQIEYEKMNSTGDIGINFKSTDSYTNMESDTLYKYFDVIFNGNITDEYKIGDKVRLTVEITTPGFYYKYNYRKIEHYN